MITSITISVRHLVEFLLRSGDIDNRTGGSDEEVMLEGSRMHRQLQKAQPEGYQAEVPLRLAWTFEKKLEDADSQEAKSHTPKGILDDTTIYVEGRADGIYQDKKGHEKSRPNGNQGRGQGDVKESARKDVQGDGKESTWTIDEIKTTYRKISRMRRPEPVHLAQAKCYAYIFAAQHDLPRIQVRMTYCNLYSGEIRYFYRMEEKQELSLWFANLMEEYRKWAEYALLWQAKRTISIRRMTFPFPFREGQKRLTAGVYRTIQEGKKLFLEAPTGTGKTISTIYPSLKAMGQGMAEKIFYVTAKTLTRGAASDTIALLRRQGLQCKSVVLTAKDKMCVLQKPECNPEKCPRARGHYDRINEALFDLLTVTDNFDQSTIETFAAKYQVCPFEMALDISIFSDVIIGDYNHVFDPHAFLRRFFGEDKARQNHIFLVDEAHNLLDRGRDMYSATLTMERTEEAQHAFYDLYPQITGKITKVNRALREIRDEWTKHTQIPSGKETAEEAEGKGTGGTGGTYAAAGETAYLLTDIDSLYEATQELQMEMESTLAEERIAQQNGHARKDPKYRKKMAVHDLLLDFYFLICHFNLICMLKDGHYVVYADEIESDAQGRSRSRNANDARKTQAGVEISGINEGFRQRNNPPKGEDATFGVKLFCVDPSKNLASCMKRARSTILFSATLLPIQYYKSLLGGKAEDYEIYARSVFDPNRRKLLVVRDVTSRYKRRKKEEYIRIADGIHNITGQRHGNYLIFCPSYAFMNEVADAYEEKYLGVRKREIVPYWRKGEETGKTADFHGNTRTTEEMTGMTHAPCEDQAAFDGDMAEERHADDAARQNGQGTIFDQWEIFEDNTQTQLAPKGVFGNVNVPADGTVPPQDISVIRQRPSMKEEQRRQFLDFFRNPRQESSMLGFCVLGGIFGEGIDLKNDTLIGAIIIGTGIPQVGKERELLRHYFDKQGKDGYQFAYTYPGMNKVLQAAGRVIRTQDDVGVVALFDERFATPAYRRLFPAEWANYQLTTVKQCGYLVEKFWNEWL